MLFSRSLIDNHVHHALILFVTLSKVKEYHLKEEEKEKMEEVKMVNFLIQLRFCKIFLCLFSEPKFWNYHETDKHCGKSRI